MNIKTAQPGGVDRRLFALYFSTFVVYGSTCTVFGAALPRIIADFGWSYTVTGLVLSAGSIGLFVSSLVTGFLLERVRSKPVFLAALCACAAGLVAFGRSRSPVASFFLLLAIGLSQGVFEVVVNFGAVLLEKHGQSRVMNLMHMGFSLGAVLGPIGVSLMLRGGRAWTFVFLIIAGLLLVLAAFSAAVPFPGPAKPGSKRKESGLSLLRQPLFILLCLAIFFYVGSELGASNWVSEYFVKVLNASLPVAAASVSLLWGGMLAGRSIISAVFHKKREEWILLALSLVSVAALLGLTASRSSLPGMALVFALGLAYSGVYPLLMSIAGKAFRSTASVGMLTTWTSLGSFIFPILLAGISERTGLRSGFLLLAVLPLGTAIVALIIARWFGRSIRGRSV